MFTDNTFAEGVEQGLIIIGWVATALPEGTESALYEAVDARWWPLVNLYLVTWGQNVCRPVSPRCGDCVIVDECPRIGVRRKRV